MDKAESQNIPLRGEMSLKQIDFLQKYRNPEFKYQWTLKHT